MDQHCYDYAKWLAQRTAQIRPEFHILLPIMSWRQLRVLADGVERMRTQQAAAKIEAQELIKRVSA